MNEHVFDELPGLLTGEHDRQTTSRIGAHLRDCDDCRQDLVVVVVAAAAMRSATRFAPELLVEEQPLPDPSLLLAEIARGGGAGPSGADTPFSYDSPDEVADAEPDAPPTTAATAAADLTGRREARQVRAAARRGWWTMAAAAVLVLAGIGVGVLVGGRQPSAPSIAEPDRTASLNPVGSWGAHGTMAMTGTVMTIKPDDLQAAPAGHYYEVWLVNRSSGVPKMVSVGVLDSTGGTYRVSDSLLRDYNTVEVSFEANDGDPAYSGDSVMSANY